MASAKGLYLEDKKILGTVGCMACNCACSEEERYHGKYE